MENLIYFSGGTALLASSLLFWIIVSGVESPLLTLMPFRWSQLSPLTLASLIIGMLSMVFYHFGVRSLHPELNKEMVRQSLFVVYILTYGIAYVCGGLYFSNPKKCNL